MLVNRLRWMAVGAVFSYASKVKTRRDIDRATAELGERLPDSLQRAVNALPGDLPRIGGAAIVARNNVATAAKATVALTRAAQKVAATPRDLGERLRSARLELGDGIEVERRRLKSDAIRATEGEAAALDALLDLRTVDLGPLPDVKPAIAPGRHRHRPPAVEPPVARVQRSYLPPADSSSRPGRNRSTDQ